MFHRDPGGTPMYRVPTWAINTLSLVLITTGGAALATFEPPVRQVERPSFTVSPSPVTSPPPPVTSSPTASPTRTRTPSPARTTPEADPTVTVTVTPSETPTPDPTPVEPCPQPEPDPETGSPTPTDTPTTLSPTPTPSETAEPSPTPSDTAECLPALLAPMVLNVDTALDAGWEIENAAQVWNDLLACEAFVFAPTGADDQLAFWVAEQRDLKLRDGTRVWALFTGSEILFDPTNPIEPYVAVHELGHALGLAHGDGDGSVMNVALGGRDLPSAEDVAQALVNQVAAGRCAA